MSVVIPVRAIEAVSTAKDPKKAILEQIGNLDGVDIIGDMVLVGTYFRPEKTSGGLFIPSTVKQEDTWQGKVGLVLKWGPDAFRDEDGEVYEQVVNIGEWAVYKIGDGWDVHINGYPCRLIRDSAIRMKVKDPSIIDKM